MITKTLALKESGLLLDFAPSDRDRESGVFLLLESGGVTTLVLDESGREHHEDLFSALPSNLRAQKVLDGGSCRQNSIKTYSFTRKWEIGWHSVRYGDIDDSALQDEIAGIITNNEQGQLLV